MKRNEGYTFIEVLIAMTILIVGIVAIMRMLPIALDQSQGANERTLAAIQADQQLGVARAAGAEDLVLRQNANWRYELQGKETGNVMYTAWNRSIQRMADPGGGYLQRVVVSVEMPDGRKESFMTYVARQ